MLYHTTSRRLRSASVALALTVTVFNFSCSKDGKKNPEVDPNVLTITNGSTCKFPNASGRNDVSLGFPHNPDRQRTTGTVKTVVIFVDFPDAPGQIDPREIFGRMSPLSENFLNTVSYSKLNVEFDPQFKWYHMSLPSSSYGWPNLTFDLHKQYIQEAVNLATVDYDFTKTDEILVIANPSAGGISRTSAFIGQAHNGILADGREMTNAITAGYDVYGAGGPWFAHEFGHSMGVADLYAYSGQLNGYMGDFSIMANVWGSAPTYTAWEQWLFGWFSDDQVTCVRGKGTGTIKLSPMEVQAGMKLLVLPTDQSATAAVIVEDRRRLGFDKGLYKEGPVAYLIDTKIANGQGTLKVLPINLNDPQKLDAPLSVGQSITYGTVTVRCTASADGGSTIEYERK